MAGQQDAEAVLLEVPTLRYEAGDCSVWDDDGFGMMSPFGVCIDNAAMRKLDSDTDSQCASDPDSNSASDPEDSSDQDVPALEIARESPENDTTCEYHGLLQACEDTDPLLFVAFEGRRIHVQRTLFCATILGSVEPPPPPPPPFGVGSRPGSAPVVICSPVGAFGVPFRYGTGELSVTHHNRRERVPSPVF